MTDSLGKKSAIVEQWFDQTLGESGEAAGRGARRTARARLRRAGTTLEIIQNREALRLVAKLPGERADRVAVLAGVLAFVEEKDEMSIACAIGPRSLKDDDAIDAVVSEIRFRRLLQATDDELLDPMRRIVRMNKGKANIRDMSVSVLGWGEEGVRKRWIFDYYGVFAGAARRENAQGAPASSAT